MPTDRERMLASTEPSDYNSSFGDHIGGAAMNISVRELKSSLSKYLRRVQTGEEITVTSRGKPVARITPAAAAGERDDPVTRLHNAPGVAWPRADSRRLPPRVRTSSGTTLSDAVRDERETAKW
jgi:prevent-host-death family protein